MANTLYRLDFEQPISELEEKLAVLEKIDPKSIEVREEIRALRRQLVETMRQVYGQLDEWDTVKVARHPDRPMFTDYLSLVFDEFVELHGDKFFGDDRALRTGFAKLDNFKLLVVGHHKGKIAQNMLEMSRLKTPIICVVIGEGGSGGALGIGVGDRVAVLEFAYYSVISPEGCAGILWKSHDYAPDAARALRLTSKHLKELGAIDDVIEEPLGAAHRDHYQMAARLKMYLVKMLRELSEKPMEQLLAERYDKFRRMGQFLEGAEA
jgi:acetyl-CoA carboxylase carboxyl transferase subunit alpha